MMKNEALIPSRMFIYNPKITLKLQQQHPFCKNKGHILKLKKSHIPRNYATKHYKKQYEKLL